VSNASAAGASLKVDFGIGGLPVDATAEQPNRAGILIIGVNRGSVAHRSGIIVGDIIYEFDGHPIKALADLQRAVAGCAANSAVAIKLYRGTDPLAVTAQF
jgi:S1-C subfamily serine protease